MTCRDLLALGFALCLFVGAGCTQPPRDDGTKPFQGNWHEVDASGKAVAKEFIFDTDLCHLLDRATKGGETHVAMAPKRSFRVDPSQNPTHIDFVLLESDNLGKTLLGIYAFENDQLKLCVAELDEPRPTAFLASEGATLYVLVRK